MKFKLIYSIIILFALKQPIFAQNDSKQRALLYFEASRFENAIIEFNKYKKTEKDPRLLIKRGISYLKSNNPDGCIKDMVAAEKLRSLDNNRYKYIAMSYMAKYDFSEAAKFFKIYLNTLSNKSEEYFEIINQIKKCGYASNFKYRTQSAFIENLGSGVNSKFDDFGPVQSPTKPERFYFSSAREGSTGGLRNGDGISDVMRGHYSSDLYRVDLKDGNWSSIFNFSSLINTPQNEILLDFSQDGSIIYFSKSGFNTNPILFTDTFNVDNIPTQASIKNGFPYDVSKGDRDLFIVNEDMMIFSAIREEGKGGYDIYYSIKKDNQWQKPVNFGYPINTIANEISPFLIKNGKALYFSSDKLETYGGFDIFQANFTIDGKIDQVSNLGYPINSPGNETDIEISHDGTFALFSSDRVEGFGGKDIYSAYFKDQITGMMETVEFPSFIHENAISGIPVADQNTSEKSNEKKLPKRDFVCKSIYFENDEDVVNSINQNTLKSLSDLMLIYPELRLQIYSHYTSSGKKDFDIYFSIKRAEKVAEFLEKSGINHRRLHLIGCGANYPIAAPFVNNVPSSLATRTNRRIDFNLVSSDQTNLNILYDYPVVAEFYRDTLWDLFIAKNQELSFRVQLTSVAQILKNEVLTLSNDVIIEKKSGDKMYLYTIGMFKSYDDAVKMQNYLMSKGFEKALVVPYFNGSALNKLDIVKLSVKYPDVEKYLSSGK